ncbi:MAG TPA: metallophosphoesterase family protein [Ktedonobacterales bacterium]|jgi:predicted phosphodiesterase|nr:metallophosphoesterase family protein [Ktedonobacterales bacterium]
MQKIAILSDIHGNLPALEAVLAAIADETITRIVCLGDVAALGPQPHEVITRLRALGCPVVMGNTDAALLALRRGDSAPGYDDDDRWIAAQLTDDDVTYIHTFQPTVSESLSEGVTLLCYHGSPRSYDERITAETSDAALDEMLAATPAQLYAGGHTHQQLLRRYRDALILNPGAVGFAKDAIAPATTIRNPSWAEYAVVASDGARLDISLRRVPFDLDALFAAQDASPIPRARWRKGEWRRV